MISIHALREEGDSGFSDDAFAYWAFLSTPSARRATAAAQCEGASGCISIHALREEGDIDADGHCYTKLISIHALREEGDLGFVNSFLQFILISIHALREEGDVSLLPESLLMVLFLSTPSARRAT